jgi:hypothetical protein
LNEEEGGSSEAEKSNSGQCLSCFNETTRRCSRCTADFFCSTSCEQKLSSKVLKHREGKCGLKVTTAEKLVVACVKDILPPDSDVCTDYRFDRFPTLWEKRCLLGLYIGLTHKLLLGIRPAQLDDWLRNGVLSKEIVRAFETLPEQNQGGYYPWFKENLGTFDSLEAEGPDLSVIFERARTCLDANDRHVKVGDLVPQAKQEAFVFYALIASGFSPEPSMEEWFDFGFVTCQSKEEEARFGAILYFYDHMFAGG